jgi:hypothetical protein
VESVCHRSDNNNYLNKEKKKTNKQRNISNKTTPSNKHINFWDLKISKLRELIILILHKKSLILTLIVENTNFIISISVQKYGT